MPYKNKEDLYKYQVARWIKRKKEAIEHMGGKCEDCGYNSHYAPMQFHHKNPLTKTHDWNKLRLMSWDKIYEELTKCILLCSNCHFIRHSNEPSI